jgi:hypothetical protein
MPSSQWSTTSFGQNQTFQPALDFFQFPLLQCRRFRSNPPRPCFQRTEVVTPRQRASLKESVDFAEGAKVVSDWRGMLRDSSVTCEKIPNVIVIQQSLHWAVYN